jgi:DNA-binding MarR family transcriptional regulator
MPSHPRTLPKSLRHLPPAKEHPAKLLPYLLNRATSRVNQLWRKALRPRGLTDARWQVLSVLTEFDGRHIGLIATMIGLEQPAASRVIDQMVRDDLVQRRPAHLDSRVVAVWITSVGRRVHAELLPEATQYVQDLVAGFSPAEIATITRLLGRLLDDVETAGEPVARKLETAS